MINKFLSFIGSKPALTIKLRQIVELGFRAEKKIIKRLFSLDGSKKVLDLGCGTGELSSFFTKEQYLGVDIDESSIQYARGHYQREFMVADGRQLPFNDASFDKVLVVGVLHHLNDEDSQRVILEIKRVLAHGGRVLIMEDTKSKALITRMMQSIDQGAYIRSEEEWRDLLRKNFQIEESFTFRSGVSFYAAFLLKKPYD